MTRVRVVDGRQVVTDTGHHHGGEELDIHDPGLADRMVTWGWVVPTDDTAPPPPGREGPAARNHRANVRARIREELATDPDRSNRAISDVVGCDHKTVGAVRADMHDRGEPPRL